MRSCACRLKRGVAAQAALARSWRMASQPPPSPASPPAPATHSGGDVALGVFICLAANLSMSLGTNILKLSFSKRILRQEELRVAAVAAGSADAAPKLPPVYTDKFWLVRRARPWGARRRAHGRVAP